MSDERVSDRKNATRRVYDIFNIVCTSTIIMYFRYNIILYYYNTFVSRRRVAKSSNNQQPKLIDKCRSGALDDCSWVGGGEGEQYRWDED